MKHIKTFEQINESAKPTIQDPRDVMSKESFAKASKMKAVIDNMLSTSVSNPVYFVVSEDDNMLTVVIDEKMDQWFDASPADRKAYYEELVDSTEVTEYTL